MAFFPFALWLPIHALKQFRLLAKLLYLSDSPRWDLLCESPVARTVISACLAVWPRSWTLLKMISLKALAVTSAHARLFDSHTAHQGLDFWNCFKFIFLLPLFERSTLCNTGAHKNAHAHTHRPGPSDSLSALFITLFNLTLVKDEEAFCGLEVQGL